MIEVDQDKHRGLCRYAIELLEYPELTDEQYAAVMADLKKPEDDAEHIAAREKLIRDRVGIGNHALIDRFDHFKPNKNVRFSTYMRKVVERWIYGNLRKHAIWE